MTIPANTGAFFGAPAAATVVEPPRTEVRLDGRAEPRLRLDRLEGRMGGAPHAWFSVGLGSSPQTDDTLRLEDLAPLIQPGRQVAAALLRGGVLPGAGRGDLLLFEGRIGRIEMRLDSEGEELRFEAEDPAGELLRRRVGGRRAWTADGSADRVEGLPLVFNPDGRPNASTPPHDPGDREPYTVFAPDSAAGSAAWTLDEAVAYLLAEHGESEVVDVPMLSEVRSIVGALVIRDVALEGRTLGEALGALLELAGARIAVVAEPGETGLSRRLEIWRPDRAPTGWLVHQPPGGRYDPAATNLAALAVRMHFEAAPRRYAARGDPKLYESTFDLVRGWDDSLATYVPEDFSPSANPDFADVRDVFRRWALNEAGDYSAAPYNRGPAPVFSSLFEGALYVRRRRRFLPCLSRDVLGRSRGVYTEVSLDGGTTWEQMNLATRVLTDECGLYLTEDPLPSRYLAAAMRGLVRIRVTATVESDACLSAERAEAGPADRPGRTRHLSVPAGYRFRQVASTSRFYGQGGADETDDTAKLQDLVDAAYEADRRVPAPACIEVPYLAMGHRPGERILGVRGRRLDLARQHAGYETTPVVKSVLHTFAPLPQTQLELE
ncbi:MAG: hypothetical protein NTU94_13420 [Planctomycetota bacterium]|nr:hypothetical protein [Planctomycetota bacterium]